MTVLDSFFSKIYFVYSHCDAYSCELSGSPQVNLILEFQSTLNSMLPVYKSFFMTPVKQINIHGGPKMDCF